MPTIIEQIGNIFDAPPRSVLIRKSPTQQLIVRESRSPNLQDACNSQGSWGAGVALALRQKYPSAYSRYRSHCRMSRPTPSALAGTCLLVEPQVGDSSDHYIACLFTSPKYGRARSPAHEILEYTRLAVQDLKSQLQEMESHREMERPAGLWAVRINSGKFGVKWERSKEVLEAAGLDIRIVRPVEVVQNDTL